MNRVLFDTQIKKLQKESQWYTNENNFKATMPNTEILPIFLLLQITATDDVHYISCFSVKLNDKVKKVQ